MIVKTKINSETTKDLNDEQLSDLVYNKGVDKYLGTFGERFENNENDKLLCQIFACSVLDAEVKNGGFDQFFLNAKALAIFAKEGLQLINANEHAKLLILAINIYEEEKYKNERNPEFDKLDEAYYALDNLSNFLREFIKMNIENFFD